MTLHDVHDVHRVQMKIRAPRKHFLFNSRSLFAALIETYWEKDLNRFGRIAMVARTSQKYVARPYIPPLGVAGS
jgi:hypothetical protein